MDLGIDDLIDWLQEQISYSGEDGLLVSELIDILRKKTAGGERTRVKDEDDSQQSGDLGAEVAPTSGRDDLDNSFPINVWRWLVDRAEVSVGVDRQWNHLSLPIILALPDPPGGAGEPSSKAKGKQRAGGSLLPASRPRVRVSEDLVWKALTGHEKNFRRLPRFEWEALVGIASSRERGIVQPDLCKLVGQDKRSLPRRTDNLASKGYIAKRTVLVAGNKTSKLWLKRFAPPALVLEDGGEGPREGGGEDGYDLSPEFLTRSLQPVSWNHRWNGELIEYNVMIRTMVAIIKAWGVIRYTDLKVKLGSHKIWQMRVIARVCRAFSKKGVTKYIAAVLRDGSRLFKDCIKFERDPTEDEMQAILGWGNGKKKVSLERRISQKSKARGKRQEAEPNHPAASPLMSQPLALTSWSPDKSLSNTVFEVVHRAGFKGMANREISNLTGMMGFTKNVALVTANLAKPGAQLSHLGAYGLVTVLEQSGRGSAYRFRSRDAVGGRSGAATTASATDGFQFPEIPEGLFGGEPESTLSELVPKTLSTRGGGTGGKKRALAAIAEADGDGVSRSAGAAAEAGPPTKKQRVEGPEGSANVLAPANSQQKQSSKKVTDAGQEEIADSIVAVAGPEPLPLGVFRGQPGSLNPKLKGRGRRKKSLVVIFRLAALKGNARFQSSSAVTTPAEGPEVLPTGPRPQVNDADGGQSVNKFSQIIEPADGRGRPKKQVKGKKAAGQRWVCDKCGGSWKNDVGLKYHQTKARTICNPNYDGLPKPSAIFGKRRYLDSPGPEAEAPADVDISAYPWEARPGFTPRGVVPRARARREREPPSSPEGSPFLSGVAAADAVAIPPLLDLSSTPVAVVEAEGPDVSASSTPKKAGPSKKARASLKRRRSQESASVKPGSQAVRPGRLVEAEASPSKPPREDKVTGPGVVVVPGDDDVDSISAFVPNDDTYYSEEDSEWPDEMVDLDWMYYQTREVFRYLLGSNGGVFPGPPALQPAITAVWTRTFPPPTVTSSSSSQRSMNIPLPNKRMVDYAVRSSVRRGEVKSVVHAFRNATGRFTQATLILDKEVDAFGPLATEVKNRMKAAFPKVYIPAAFRPLPEQLVDVGRQGGKTAIKGVGPPTADDAAATASTAGQLTYAPKDTFAAKPRRGVEVADDVAILDSPVYRFTPAKWLPQRNWKPRPAHMEEEGAGARAVAARALNGGASTNRQQVANRKARAGRHGIDVVDNADDDDDARIRLRLTPTGRRMPQAHGKFVQGQESEIIEALLGMARGQRSASAVVKHPEQEVAVPSTELQFLEPNTYLTRDFDEKEELTFLVDGEGDSPPGGDVEGGDVSALSAKNKGGRRKRPDPQPDAQGFVPVVVLDWNKGKYWEGLKLGWFEEHSYSFTMTGPMPTQEWLLYQNLPKAIDEIGVQFQARFKAENWPDQSYGLFRNRVLAVQSWEQSFIGKSLLSFGTIAPKRYIFINHTVPDPSVTKLTAVTARWSNRRLFLGPPFNSRGGCRSKDGGDGEHKDDYDYGQGTGGIYPPPPRRRRKRRRTVLYPAPDGEHNNVHQNPYYAQLPVAVAVGPASDRIGAEEETWTMMRTGLAGPTRPLRDFTSRALTTISADPTHVLPHHFSFDLRASRRRENTLLVALVVVRTLLGGTDRHMDWGLLTRLFPRIGISTLKREWSQLQKSRAHFIALFEDKFHEAFLDAYARDEMPTLDYDDVDAYDWRRLVEWALRIPLHRHVSLPSSRREMDRDFALDSITAADARDWRETYTHWQTPVAGRFAAVASVPAIVALEKKGGRSNDDMDEMDLLDDAADFALARSWIRALCHTHPRRYTPESVRDRFLDTFGRAGRRSRRDVEALLLRAAQDLNAAKVVKFAWSGGYAASLKFGRSGRSGVVEGGRVMKEAPKARGGRRRWEPLQDQADQADQARSSTGARDVRRMYEIHEHFNLVLKRMARHALYRDAAAFKAALDAEFEKNARRGRAANDGKANPYLGLTLPYDLSSGVMMALIDMQAYRRIDLVPFGVPDVPLGFEPGKYETRKFPKEYYHFGLRLLPVRRRANEEGDEDQEEDQEEDQAGRDEPKTTTASRTGIEMHPPQLPHLNPVSDGRGYLYPTELPPQFRDASLLPPIPTPPVPPALSPPSPSPTAQHPSTTDRLWGLQDGYLPPWVDLFGAPDRRRWAAMVAAVLHVLATRAALDAEACAAILRPILERRDAQLVIAWARRAGVVGDADDALAGRGTRWAEEEVDAEKGGEGEGEGEGKGKGKEKERVGEKNDGDDDDDGHLTAALDGVNVVREWWWLVAAMQFEATGYGR